MTDEAHTSEPGGLRTSDFELRPISDVALSLNVSRVRVRFYHMDPTSIFHGRVFELFEEARTEAFRRVGFEYRVVAEAGQAMIVTGVDAQFHQPVRFDDLLDIGVFVSLLSRVRITIEYEARRAGSAEIVLGGHTAFAFVDTVRGRPVPVPPSIVSAVHRYPGMLREQATRPRGRAGINDD